MKKENGLATGVSESDMVLDYMKKLEHPLKNLVETIRQSILSTDKSIGEGIYWNAPTFYYTGKMKPFDPKKYMRYVVGFNFYKQDTLRLIFLRGANAADPKGIMEGDYADGRRIVSIQSPEDFKKKEPELKKIIRQLVAQMG